jgi:hypothetical protein
MISFCGIDISGQRGETMIRTIISMSDDDKAWLDRRARERGVTMTELVRQSITLYREMADPADSGFTSALAETHGIWTGLDGLTYQRTLREEWGAGN